MCFLFVYHSRCLSSSSTMMRRGMSSTSFADSCGSSASTSLPAGGSRKLVRRRNLPLVVAANWVAVFFLSREKTSPGNGKRKIIKNFSPHVVVVAGGEVHVSFFSRLKATGNWNSKRGGKFSWEKITVRQHVSHGGCPSTKLAGTGRWIRVRNVLLKWVIVNGLVWDQNKQSLKLNFEKQFRGNLGRRSPRGVQVGVGTDGAWRWWPPGENVAADRVVVLALVATSGDNGTCAAAVRRADRRGR